MQFRNKRASLCVAVLAAVAAMAIGGCGGGSDSDGGNGGGGSGETYKIGVVFPDATYVYWQSMIDGAKTAAADNSGVQLEVASGTSGSDATQVMIRNINDLITKGVDGLIVADGFPQLTPTLKRALAKRIPVVFTDANVGDLTSDEVTTVATDPINAARQAGEFIIDHLKGRGEVGLLHGHPGFKVSLDRTKAAKDAFAGTDVKVVAELPTTCERVRAITATKDMMTAHPEIDVIYSACAVPALGAIQALKQLGLTGKVQVVGFDASDEELKAIEAGTELASVAQFPRKQGEIAVQKVIEAIKTGTVPPDADSGTEIITRDNLDSVRNN
jgi:ribose transport system substrate-binding protein